MDSALVIGEALVDVVEGVAHPGGSPMNVAVGLARLEVPTVLHSQFGADAHGAAIARHLQASGVAVTEGTVTDGPTSIAQAVIGADGAASYRFDISWNPARIDTAGYALVHTGSIGAVLEPGADVVEELLDDAVDLVSFDPNVRPALMGDRDAAVRRIERLVGLADVVKASDEDIAWLYPGEPIGAVLERWERMGPRFAVVTRGGDGADARVDGVPLHVDVPETRVVDTIGAGDSFMAGLLYRVLRHGFDEPQASLAFAARCAAITVSRAGANPPTLAEALAS